MQSCFNVSNASISRNPHFIRLKTAKRFRRAWRNGSAFDSRSKGWVFESPCPHFSLSFSFNFPFKHWVVLIKYCILSILSVILHFFHRFDFTCWELWTAIKEFVLCNPLLFLLYLFVSDCYDTMCYQIGETSSFLDLDLISTMIIV